MKAHVRRELETQRGFLDLSWSLASAQDTKCGNTRLTMPVNNDFVISPSSEEPYRINVPKCSLRPLNCQDSNAQQKNMRMRSLQQPVSSESTRLSAPSHALWVEEMNRCASFTEHIKDNMLSLLFSVREKASDRLARC